MRQTEMIEIVENAFKAINKLSHEILREFNSDDIHEFRVEVKSLRAFLRIIHMNNEDEKSVIPKLLKTFYGYIGIIQNVQLQKHRLFEYITKYKADKPHTYTDILDKEKTYWQGDAVALMEDNNFNSVKEEIIKQLPGKIEAAQIKKFVEAKLNALTVSVDNLQDEVNIHTTRKILKDLLYTWNYMTNKSIFPKAIGNEEKLKSITDKLEDFRNICIELEFMQPEYIDRV